MNPDWDGVMKARAREGERRVVPVSTEPLGSIRIAATRIEELMQPRVVVTNAVIEEIRALVAQIRQLAGG